MSLERDVFRKQSVSTRKRREAKWSEEKEVKRGGEDRREEMSRAEKGARLRANSWRPRESLLAWEFEEASA